MHSAISLFIYNVSKTIPNNTIPALILNLNDGVHGCALFKIMQYYYIITSHVMKHRELNRCTLNRFIKSKSGQLYIC